MERDREGEGEGGTEAEGRVGRYGGSGMEKSWIKRGREM